MMDLIAIVVVVIFLLFEAALEGCVWLLEARARQPRPLRRRAVSPSYDADHPAGIYGDHTPEL